jgi:hypothetical protein
MQPDNSGQERLVYSMHYGKFQVGTFETEVAVGQDSSITLTGRMRTSALYRQFFWVDNVYVTYADAELRPRRIVKQVRQKNLSHTIDIAFDDEVGIARTTDGRQWEAPAGTRDIFSLVYHLRKFPLAVGEKRAYALDGEGLAWELTAEHLGREEVSTSAGTCVADKVMLRFSARSRTKWRAWKTDILTNRLSGAATGVVIWFSAAGDRVPMQMVFPSSPFDLRMSLTRCEGVSLTGQGRR